ncbi:unnamed protein product [Vitrella brassicaformis CCMP3155]|uniref:Tr-type G domain-containing protein n=1 Tax=Vitrella brassicaformis (strain CCMP3155) TaxID=1169540 RepID=A0A0G4FNX9_VITBC|nr:unnamed protein product [Vitrella brassicaformis CCMP3155]|eukprot:CEM15900.1 unnamed protein product [Vitrella brassicaformis CCMP3155]
MMARMLSSDKQPPDTEVRSSTNLHGSVPMARRLNVNVGVLGHVDSGKTSLVRALSRVTSTAALDKHPQSQERGITIDLGFSAFFVKTTVGADEAADERERELQFCLVDCPGHASLIKTIIGGAHIIDLVLLVIDATKGVQTQTQECLVIAEILAQHVVVVLNKVDLIPEEQRHKKLEKLTTGLRKQVFGRTLFGSDVPILPVSANPGAEQDVTRLAEPIGIASLINTMVDTVRRHPPRRPSASDAASSSAPMHMVYDHSFPLKGKGTVLTGTLLSGRLEVGQNIVIYPHAVQTRVRTIQSFKQDLPCASHGDRVSICVPAIGGEKLERGMVTSVGAPLPTLTSCVAVVQRIKYFKGQVRSKAKFHCTIGHTTVMANVHFFGLKRKNKPTTPTANTPSAANGHPPSPSSSPCHDGLSPASVSNPSALGVGLLVREKAAAWPDTLDVSLLYDHLDELPAERPPGGVGGESGGDGGAVVDAAEFELFFCLLHFEKPVQCPLGSLLMGSKFDLDAHSPSCRLAFFGRLLTPISDTDVPMSSLRVLKPKVKTGHVDRVTEDGYCVIGKDLFKKETDISQFVGLRVTHEPSKHVGVIEGAFGTSGKFKVRFADPLPSEWWQAGKKRGGGGGGGGGEEGNDGGLGGRGRDSLVLVYQKNAFDKKGKLMQAA